MQKCININTIALQWYINKTKTNSLHLLLFHATSNQGMVIIIISLLPKHRRTSVSINQMVINKP